MWQVGLRISWLTQGLHTLSWPPTPEPTPPKLVPFWVIQEKLLQKIHLNTSLLLGWANIFPPDTQVTPEYPIPLLRRDLSPPSKYCNYCSPNRDALKLSRGANYFYQPPSETTPEWERPLMDVWSKNPQVSSSTDGKSRLDYIPLWSS